MKNAIVYTIVFAGIEILVGSLVLLAYQLLKGTGTELDAMGVIISSGLAGVVTIAVFLAAKWAVVSSPLDTYPSLDCLVLVCDSYLGISYSIIMASGIDARTTKYSREGF